jgi:hypothetical protein
MERKKKEIESMSFKQQKSLFIKTVTDIQLYQETYRQLLVMQKKIKQSVAGAEAKAVVLKKILVALENKESTRPNPLLALFLNRPDLFKEEDKQEFWI